MLKLIFAALVLGGFCFANIIKDDVYLKGQKEYDLKEVCDFFYKQDYPLIEIISITKLDCMKATVDVSSFCKKKQADDPFLIRGHIDKKKKKVICQSASRVILKYDCSKDGGQYCEDSSVGCYILRDRYAIRLKIIHHSLLNESKGKKVLTCYFQSKDLEQLDEKILKTP